MAIHNPSLSVELNDRSMMRSIVLIGFCFEKNVDKHKVIFKEKQMIHFYKPVLTLLCKYYGFILFKWVFVVVFAVELQIKCSIQSRK